MTGSKNIATQKGRAYEHWARSFTCGRPMSPKAAVAGSTGAGNFAIALVATGALSAAACAQVTAFDALIGAISVSKVSVASANAMRAKMDAAGLTHEAAIIAAGRRTVCAIAGLSRRKFAIALALAEAGSTIRVHDAPDALVIETLTAVPVRAVGRRRSMRCFRWAARLSLPQRRSGLARGGQKSCLICQSAQKPKQLASMAQDWSPLAIGCSPHLFFVLPRWQTREGIS